ncbi:MAG: radical SAM protein [Acidobacteria bacterium]|jgi:uncharacterized protein|nr:radical SAM protein [Acidobacteriota bacterium]
MNENFTLFKTRNGTQYLYDAHTSSIHPWNPPLDEELAAAIYKSSDDQLESFPFPDDRFKFYIRLWRLKTGAFQGSKPFPRLKYKKYGDIPLLNRGIVRSADMILITTDSCNLRCKYCVYSAFYSNSGYRTHGEKIMPFEVAQKAIDRFFSYNDSPIFHGYADRNLNIAFYGGEPLLNFDLIKEGILYAKKKKRDHYGLVLSVITNLTLLKDEHIRFFRDNDISLMVSLDGPPEEHDRYRHFQDGGGTHNVVFQNLQKIREFDEIYYFKNVRVQVTMNGNSDVIDIYNYFMEVERRLPLLQIAAFLKDFPFSKFHDVYPFDNNVLLKKMESLMDTYYNQKIQGKVFLKGEFFYFFIEKTLSDVYYRIQSKKAKHIPWYTSACYPGRKIAVYPDGKFHICERINEHFPIGDVDNGIDGDKVVAIVNKYFESLPQCHQCWARNFCYICYAVVCDHDNFSSFEENCALTRHTVEKNFALLYSILEKRPDAFLSEELKV